MITEVAAFNMHRDDVQNNQWSKRELTWSGVRLFRSLVGQLVVKMVDSLLRHNAT